MRTEDYPAFKRILGGMARLYGSDPDGAVLDAYWLALKDWPLAEFESSAGHLMRTAKFMPRPADFNELRKAEGETPAEAWCQVLDAVRRMRPYDVVSIDDRTDRVVRALGGYRQLGMTDSHEMHFREKRFAELWDELGAVDETRKALPFIGSGREGPQRLTSAVSVRDTFADQPEVMLKRMRSAES